MVDVMKRREYTREVCRRVWTEMLGPYDDICLPPQRSTLCPYKDDILHDVELEHAPELRKSELMMETRARVGSVR